jgi:hypothetical protein
MITKELNPKLALNKAFLKIKPNRTEIEIFKSNLITLLDKLKTVEERPKDESEEHLKNDIRDFLRDTFYKDTNAINTKDKKDLVIHLSKDTNSKVGVIIEAKRPSNKGEMLSKDNLNKKALQELLLYYLRERITLKNLDLKHLIVTNINEWYIFDEHLFERLFNKKELVKQFESFEFGKKSTSVFYKEIAEPFIQGIKNEIEYTYFNLKDYESALRNQDKKDDKQLIELFKLLSPPHLLKLPFNNDSNSLDKNFYGELLHIIGLVEVKDGGKKLIQRPDLKNRNSGSLLENTINQLDSLDKLSRLTNPKQYGKTTEERLFNVGLELCITWVNRILFLKLLEAQLISYHKGDRSYSFLNKDLIHDYDNLNSLFFMVLAKKPEERNQRVKDLFSKVPYLNSSLFEPTVLEHEALFISGLEDNIPLPFLSSTVIKDNHGNKEKGSREGLGYLFDFLSSYDFTSDSSEDIQEDNKSLINASVLGLIFEKINGYKDGSFFTPGFITEYMCRETIRRAVVQKFNEVKSWSCKEFGELYNKIDDINEANQIVNDIKICDPAVGSGHFLVSALNEMISVKNDLKILQDRKGQRLKEYHVEIVNDELFVTDEDGDLFEYNPTSKESQRIQETLFHEKQTIIENCLFGVDINPNSVKICRLRLWIELLKNAYYKNPNELETLPNIDINIKCGNSLVSRFSVDTDLKEIMKKSKWSIEEYKNAVDTYRNAESKDQKREMELLINDIKSNFKSEITSNDPKVKRLYTLNGEITKLTTQQSLFEPDKKEKTLVDKQVQKLIEESKRINSEIEEIKSNKIYENAFEWRFEFPEVLNNEGEFVGFDVIIGNPPYFSLEKSNVDYFALHNVYKSIEKRGDIYTLFYELGLKLLKSDYDLCFITSSTWMRSNYGKSLRNVLLNDYNVKVLIDFSDYPVFESATVLTNIIIVRNNLYNNNTNVCVISKTMSPNIKSLNEFLDKNSYIIKLQNDGAWSITSSLKHIMRTSFESKYSSLKDLGYSISNGFRTGFNEAFIIDEQKKTDLIESNIKNEDIIKPIIRGRDIKKYYTSFENIYVIIVAHGMGQELEKNYPDIFNHLIKFEHNLKNRGQVKNGQHHWLELDNHPSFDYLKLFELPKITYPEITKFLPFFLDKNIFYYSNNKTFFINGCSLETLVGYLNSKLFKFLYLETFPELQGNSRELRKIFMETIPFKSIEDDVNEKFKIKVDKIIELKKQNPLNDTSDLESEIDTFVYQLFELTSEEIKIIESS